MKIVWKLEEDLRFPTKRIGQDRFYILTVEQPNGTEEEIREFVKQDYLKRFDFHIVSVVPDAEEEKHA
jgi:hypothetical protein